jgi:hypothetical protein
LTLEVILKANIKKLVKRIEINFNTKVIDFGISKYNEQKFKELLPLGFLPPKGAIFMAYLYIPIDEEDNIITLDYFEKYQNIEGVNLNDILGLMKAESFSSNLRHDTEVCKFIRMEFRAGNIYNIGTIRIDTSFKTENMIKNIDKIEDVRYRLFFYFIDENLSTL